MGLWVCVSMSVCPTEYLRNHTRDLYLIFVHVACVRGSVLLRHVYDRPHRVSPGRGFLPIEIPRKGMGEHSAGEVCLVLISDIIGADDYYLCRLS